MIYDELPIFKSTLDFVVYIETIVIGFDKYHKYTIGVDLRTHSKKMLFLVHKANVSKENRVKILEDIRDSCEEMVASFNAHIKHASSYRLKNKVGVA